MYYELRAKPTKTDGSIVIDIDGLPLVEHGCVLSNVMQYMANDIDVYTIRAPRRYGLEPNAKYPALGGPQCQ